MNELEVDETRIRAMTPKQKVQLTKRLMKSLAKCEDEPIHERVSVLLNLAGFAAGCASVSEP